MIIIKVKEGDNIEKALKQFKRKFNALGVLNELRDRQQFEKPSSKRRKIIKKAKYVQKLKDKNNI